MVHLENPIADGCAPKYRSKYIRFTARDARILAGLHERVENAGEWHAGLTHRQQFASWSSTWGLLEIR
jgi:hypothetical protein